ncbi:MAG: ferritin-like domain-containing protein [Gammaproteobacteria bacterium]|nr:MAG: ferritin-like domain-containing protein [Gammaproteobacteria bacterium]
MRNIFECARECIATADPDRKCLLTREAQQAWQENVIDFSMPALGPDDIADPGRPAKPQLVPPSQLPRRKLGSGEGRAAFLHALAHIEFNAINLAWDAVYRFRDMPVDYYSDWLGVAADEARHFALLRERLRDLDHDYGDFPAHDGLWDMAVRTAHDVLARMALVPRVLEARGLDVTPSMISRLRQLGDMESVRILDIILQDEIGHVECGSRWFKHLCRERGLEPLPTFMTLIDEFLQGRVRRPLNLEARIKAGFCDNELELLKTLAMEPA